MRRLLVIAVAVPSVAGTLAMMLFIGLEAVGATPLAVYPQNIAEAAAMGNGAETLRRLLDGEDPNRIQDVSPEIISGALTRLTALEAAVLSKRVQLVQLLDSRGVIVNADTRLTLSCIAHAAEARDIVDYLTPGADIPCEHPQAVIDSIMARTSE